MTKKQFETFVQKQIITYFPDDVVFDKQMFSKCVDQALQRTEYCFSKVNNRYFTDQKNTLFNHLNGDQYSMFLYILSNTLYRNECDPNICTKVFLLNKTLFSIDVFYEVELPDIFLFVHPLGTVLGRGNYANYFVVYQRCNVGSNKDIYPTFSEHLTMHPGSAVLGNCTIGRNCRIAAHSLLIDNNLDANTLYAGSPKDFILRSNMGKNIIWF